MTHTIFNKLRMIEKENRRNAIVDVAEQILHNEGLEAVTIRKVANEAGLSSGAMYMYFSNKEELLLSMLVRNLKVLKCDMSDCLDNNNPVEAIKKMGYHYKRYFIRFGKHINLLRFAVKNNQTPQQLKPYLLDDLNSTLSDLLSLVQQLLSSPSMEEPLKGIPPERAVPVFWALIQGLVQITLTGSGPSSDLISFDFDQLINDATRIFT